MSFCGSLREGGALVEHAVDPGPQRPHAPALDAAHLGVEVALERVLERNQGEEVGPAQLSHQCCDNLPVREDLGELDHAAEILLGEPSAEFGLQLSPQRGDNLARRTPPAVSLRISRRMRSPTCQ